jgi:VCBS repeat-containing protein
MKKTLLLLNLLLFTMSFGQNLPSVTSITVDHSTISENGGVNIITATISEVSDKTVSIPLTISGTASFDVDYVTIFSSKGYSTVAGGNGEGDANNQFTYPHSSDIDSSGNLYVADYFNWRVMKWEPGATEGTVVAGGNGGVSYNSKVTYPSGIKIDSSGNFYVVDTYYCRVMKWLPGATEGIVVAGGNGEGDENNQLFYPSGIDIDSFGNIYVADFRNNRVMKWAPGASEGVVIAGGNGEGAAGNQLNLPTDIYVDSLGDFYVSDGGNNRVMKWVVGSTEGIIVAGGNGAGSASNQLGNPEEIHLDSSGNLYVADSGNNRIMKWAPGASEGIVIAGGNKLSSDDSFTPCGINLDLFGNIYITDTQNNRVQKIQISPEITIPAGSTTGSISFRGIEDVLYEEEDETIIVTPSNPINATLANLESKTIIIIDHNSAPVAIPQSITSTEQIEKVITLTGTDTENDALTYFIETLPSNGMLTDPNNNNATVYSGYTLHGTVVSYTSTSDIATTDSFTFKVNDGLLDSSIATSSISISTINDVPVLSDDSVSTNEDTSVNITLKAIDPDDSQISYALVSPATNGSVSIVNNIATYVPSENFYGDDSFTVTANDGEFITAPSTILVTVKAVNDKPKANNNAIVVDEGAISTIIENDEISVLYNDTDAENDPLTVVLVSAPVHGSLTLSSDGTFSYEHDGTETISDSFTYKTNDGSIDGDIAIVTITIKPVNDNIPTDIILSNNSFKENSYGVVGGLSVVDLDLSYEDYAYELVDGKGDDDNTSFLIIGTKSKYITLSKVLDYEDKKTLSIRVKVTDENNQSLEKVFTINVINVNDISLSSEITNSYCSSGPSASGAINITSVNQTFGAVNYSWSVSNGGLIPSGQENNQSLTNLTPGTYYLSLSDTEFSYYKSFNIALEPQYNNLSICYVSSDDSEKTKNRIHLNNQGNYNVAFYEVLRESHIANIYTNIGSILATEDSFLDPTSNNMEQSYKYKVRFIDNCGNTSLNSTSHKTILLQSSIAVNKSVNLNWSQYEGSDYTTYNIYRKVNDEDFELINSVSAGNNSYNDSDANTDNNDYEYYVSISVDNCVSFNKSRKSNNSNEIKSNIQSILSQLSLDNIISENQLSVYPNPTNNILHIKLDNDLEFVKGEVYSAFGPKVLITEEVDFPVENLASGTYFIKVFTSEGTAIRRFIKQ